MTYEKRLQFQICISDAEIKATTWTLADMERIIRKLERVIYGITLNEQRLLKKEFSLCLIEFDAWRQTIGIQALRKTIE
jgi:hypothetical protein